MVVHLFAGEGVILWCGAGNGTGRELRNGILEYGKSIGKTLRAVTDAIDTCREEICCTEYVDVG